MFKIAGKSLDMNRSQEIEQRKQVAGDSLTISVKDTDR